MAWMVGAVGGIGRAPFRRSWDVALAAERGGRLAHLGRRLIGKRHDGGNAVRSLVQFIPSLVRERTS